jgi:hypothetical protein
VRPTQSSSKWTLGDLAPEVKQPAQDSVLSPSTAKLKNVWYGAQLSTKPSFLVVNEPADCNYFTLSYKLGFRELSKGCPDVLCFCKRVTTVIVG